VCMLKECLCIFILFNKKKLNLTIESRGFHLCTIEVPMVYTISQLECATYQCYFINALFDIFFKGCVM